MANCFPLAYVLSGSLTVRALFPVSNLFISQDPRLSYLHVHCKCNVNESSDKIFLYFVIWKEFLYRRPQRRRACTPSLVFEWYSEVVQDHLAFFLFSIQICYMSVRPFSKEFIQLGFLWLKKKSKNKQKQLTIIPKAFCALFLLKEPSLRPFPPSIESILYEVIVIF